MTAPAQDTPGTGIAGTDFDPYKDQGTDTLVLLFAWWPWFVRLISPFTGFIPFHNYRQWHVWQNAVVAGWNSAALKYGVVPAIPDCPILWQDVRHYWSFGGWIGVIAYLVFAAIWVKIGLVVIGVLLAILATLGSISWDQAIRILLQQMGINLTS